MQPRPPPTLDGGLVSFDELFEIFAFLGVQEEEHAGYLFVHSRHMRRHLRQDMLRRAAHVG